MKIFDVGLFDGADTAYYLERGHDVVAVEANPTLVEAAQRRFAKELAAGRFTCVHAAVSADGAEVELTLCGQDLGSSSIVEGRVNDRRPEGTVRVPGVTPRQLFERHGVPDYLKVDIEGADRFCVLPLTPEARPKYLSFEVGADVDELLSHAESIGYRSFKIIEQTSFRELENQWCLYDRAAFWLMRRMGYDQPNQIRRGGRFFTSGHSTGPLPWESDGRWRSAAETRARYAAARAANALSGWYDIHAMA